MDDVTREQSDALVGRAIARHRTQRGWSQRALAKVVGLDQSALSRVEAGKRRVGAGELDAFARALQVPVAALVAGQADLPARAPQHQQAFEHGDISADLAPHANPDLGVSQLPGEPDASRGSQWLSSFATATPAPSTPEMRRSSSQADEDLSPRRSDDSEAAAADAPPTRLRRALDEPGLRALHAAVDDAEGIYQRLRAERLASGGDEPEGYRSRGGSGAQRAHMSAPGPPEPLAPSLSHRLAPGRFPQAVDDVVRDWFEMRPLAEALRERGRPQAAARSDGDQARQRGSSPVLGQTFTWESPRDRIARFWRQELRVDPRGPVPDLVPLLEDAGVEVVVVRLGSETPVCGGSVREDVPFLFVNAARPVVLQRFALAHAFGHLVLGHGAVVDERIDWGRGHARETATNEFAEELLAPVEAVADWYRRHGRRSPDLDTIVELANAFGISFWAALYRSRAAGRLSPRQAAPLSSQLGRQEWQLLPRQAFLGGHKDTLATLTPVEAAPNGSYGPPAVLRVPAHMRAWAFAAVAAGVLSMEQAARRLRLDPDGLAGELALAGLE